jgi:hypothetical protein
LSGGALSFEGDGRETVSFPVSVAREASPLAAIASHANESVEALEHVPSSLASAVEHVPSSLASALPPMPSHPALPAHGALPHVDELYEHVVERLRRDLLVERERMGDLLGDLP